MAGPSRLTSLQSDVLREFFAREKSFYLTGGAALAGFHLGHRTTHDLDLFVADDRLEAGERALADAARAMGAQVESVTTAPDYRRRLLRRGADSIVVDLVRERTFQVVPEKPSIGGIRVDPPEEILANKLCALLSRAEVRDLVDVYALEQSGLCVERALATANRKDGGATPAQLAWVLDQIALGDEAHLPGDVPAPVLRDWLRGLVVRLVRAALPPSASR